MRTIRRILLTEYIGAIVIAVLIADACSAMFTTAVEQITYHLYFSKLDISQSHRLSTTYSVLGTSTRVALYLISAYLLVQWLYPAKTSAVAQGAELHEDQKPEARM
jgi:hypothetical protein